MIHYTLKRITSAFALFLFMGLSALLEAQVYNWGSIGPVYTAGRSRNIIADKTDASGNTLYTGSASSGLFRTKDGGTNWSPVNDFDVIKNISYIAQDKNNIIWAATGEGFLRYGQKAKAKRGTGLYQLSANDLLIQKQDSNAVGAVINRIACSPVDANYIALATNLGILVSTNGGASFSAPASIPATANQTFGMDIKFDSNGILYCTIGNERGDGNFANVVGKIYKSSDASLSNFSDITPSSSTLTASNYGRIELAIAPSNNNVIYASIANKYIGSTNPNIPPPSPSTLKGVFVSYDGGTTWGLVLQGSSQIDPLSSGGSSSGDYAHVLLVDPTNSNRLFMGGYSFYIFTRTGGTDNNPIGVWNNPTISFIQNIQYYIHENIHDIKIVTAGSSTRYYFVTDAGIYRSVDNLTTFQPFYKGLVTGQFNSVSIENFPRSTNASTATSGESVIANDGFIGGTGGNGMVYYSGTSSGTNLAVAEESAYNSGEFYNSEFSKILPSVAFFSKGDFGHLFRTSDVKTSSPTIVNVNSYTGVLSKIAPSSQVFQNNAFINTSGTPFKLWENYGQVASPPDSLVFYNDTIVVQASIFGIASLTTQTTFTFSSGRPNKFALIDSIVFRTAAVELPITPSVIPTAFTGSDKKDIFVKLANNYTVGTTFTSPPITNIVGPASAASVTLDPTTFLDEISVTFTSPPFANKTFTYSNITDPSAYYKVFATVFYKYKVGDEITITDNSISTITSKYTFTLSTPLRWSDAGDNGSKPFSSPTNPIQKIPAKISSRLALVYNNNGVTQNQNAIVVSKGALNLNDPLNFVRVSQNGALTCDANGLPTTNTIAITGKPNLLEWSKSGTELYFATDDYKLYRVSYLNTILDLSPSSYSGKLSTDIFKYSSPPSTTINPNSPYRTTLLSTFLKPITSISISNDDASMILTFNDPTGDKVKYSTNSIKTSNFSNINFVSKTGNFPNEITNCSLLEKDDNKKVFIGTDKGVYYTSDISVGNPIWVDVNTLANGGITSKLPNVQVFDIKQQTLSPAQSYNSGVIYVATNGRGIWSNRSFFTPYVVSVNELDNKNPNENNLNLYPNPTNASVFVNFTSIDGEVATLQIMDINGRLVKSENLGKLYAGKAIYSFETTDLNSGMYIVNISGTSGIKRVAKLIVTK
jgi:hypothetical protein